MEWKHRNCVLGWEFVELSGSAPMTRLSSQSLTWLCTNMALFFVSHSCNQRPEDGFMAVARNKIELGLVFVDYSVC